MDSDIELAKPRYNINGGEESEEYENIRKEKFTYCLCLFDLFYDHWIIF